MSLMVNDICLPRIAAVLILDGDGQRLTAKFFSPELQGAEEKVNLQVREIIPNHSLLM